MNRIASLGAEVVTTRERIGSLVGRKKKDAESQKILIQLQNRLTEIQNELVELGGFIDAMGFVRSFKPREFSSPSFLDWAKSLMGA